MYTLLHDILGFSILFLGHLFVVVVVVVVVVVFLIHQRLSMASFGRRAGLKIALRICEMIISIRNNFRILPKTSLMPKTA